MRNITDFIAGNKTCHYTSISGAFHLADATFLSQEHVCAFCGGKEHFTYCVDSGPFSVRRAWICANTDCLTYSDRSACQPCLPTKKLQRALEWPLFCVISGDE